MPLPSKIESRLTITHVGFPLAVEDPKKIATDIYINVSKLLIKGVMFKDLVSNVTGKLSPKLNNFSIIVA